MKEYEVTIAIPVYNVAEYIESSLLSALNQTFQSIEYLIIDDKGQDGSMDIVRRIMNEHLRGNDMKIVDQRYNKKTGAARNAGLDNAVGRYLFFLDGDDVLSLDCIEILYNAMRQHPVDFVSASFVRRDLRGVLYAGCQYDKDILIDGSKHAVFDFCYGKGNKVAVSLCNRLYNVAFLRNNHIRCVPGQTHEDSWFTYQVLMQASSCRLLPDCTLFYTYNPNSSSAGFSNGYSESTAQQFVDIQRMKCGYIRPYVKMSFYRGALIDILKMSLYHAYQVEISSQINEDDKKKFESSLLTPPFTSPKMTNKVGISCPYILYRLFNAFPLQLKLLALKIGAGIKVKQFIRRWIHF